MSTPEISRKAALREINNRLFFRIFQATNMIHAKGTKALLSVGVTTQQWSIVGALSRPQADAGISVGELCEYLLMSRQNLSGSLDRLERDGYVVRVQSDEDRRVKRVKLTSEGRRLWKTLDPLIYAFYDAALSSFSFDERVEFLHQINKLHRNMSAL